MKASGILSSEFLKATVLIIFCTTTWLGCQQNDSQVKADLPEQIVSDSDGIIGGVKVTPQDPIAATTVGIVDLRGPGVICTGSIIGTQTVVTAAHCVLPTTNYMAILFSSHVPQSNSEWRTASIKRVLAAETHDNWSRLSDDQEKNWGDVAILKFSGSIPTGYKIAQMIRDSSSLRSRQKVILAGFGYTNGVTRKPASDLRKTTVQLYDPRFSEMEVSLDQTQGRGACHGDSGGPAFVQVGKDLLLMGVTSRGHLDPADTCQHYAIYSNLGAFKSWIAQVQASF